jgi:hypothetical protein
MSEASDELNARSHDRVAAPIKESQWTAVETAAHRVSLQVVAS